MKEISEQESPDAGSDAGERTVSADLPFVMIGLFWFRPEIFSDFPQ